MGQMTSASLDPSPSQSSAVNRQNLAMGPVVSRLYQSKGELDSSSEEKRQAANPIKSVLEHMARLLGGQVRGSSSFMPFGLANPPMVSSSTVGAATGGNTGGNQMLLMWMMPQLSIQPNRDGSKKKKKKK